MDEVSCSRSSRGEASAARGKPLYVKLGDRQIFTVELRPGETTFVSWKKLLKDANKSDNPRADNVAVNADGIGSSTAAPSVPTSSVAHPALESRIAPGQPGENEAPQTSRFSAVIEKIERLYMGKDSSDEEDLKDVPDDDQYDTEDSFIDDAELDEYFEVDNSQIKHDGFFVNRGKLERKEQTNASSEQPKKRRKKDTEKPPSDVEKRLVSKHSKPVKPGSIRADIGSSSSRPVVVSGESFNDAKSHLPPTSTGYLKKKNPEAKTNTSLVKLANGSNTTSPLDNIDVDKAKPQGNQSKSSSQRSKDISAPSSSSHQNYVDKGISTPVRSQSPKVTSGEVDVSIRSKDKNGVRELPDLNSFPDSRSVSAGKMLKSQRRESLSCRSKSSLLERSIRDLERIVAESRPPALGNSETDPSAQAIKRRLPPEIKLKLAKVARLAGREGRISKELINRLMNSLGHLIQVRTLKRNLRDMISTGQRVKQEKNNVFQQLKKEVIDMIKTRAQSLEIKGNEQQVTSSNDNQHGSEEKGAVRPKANMDSVLEDKICDLYDLFVDGLDEEAGPQVRKLYAELASLWPNGFMDNHGIKMAICRSKDRKRAISSRLKGEDKLYRKKAARVEEASAGANLQQQIGVERQKQEAGVKKKLKRKAESEVEGAGTNKSPKHSLFPSQKSSSLPTPDTNPETVKS